MIYIYKILSRENSKLRVSFFLPLIGLLVGTIFLILISSIMDGMESEIFSKLDKIDNGYKIYLDTIDEIDFLKDFLDQNNIDYYSQNTRDVIIGDSKNYLFAKLITRNQNLDMQILNLGNGISRKLGLSQGDYISIFSPLDAKLTTMKFPIKKMEISDIFSVPVLDFDNLYIISNDIEFSDALNTRESIVIAKSISREKLSLIQKNFDKISILPWLDDYSTLLNAIKLEKTMYRVFAYLLIAISALGLFSTMNYTITNKKRSLVSICNLGYSFSKIKMNAFKLMSLLSIFFSIAGIALTYILIYFHLFDPLLEILFPGEIFYNFMLTIDPFDAFRIIIINTIVVIFSVYIPFNNIHSSIYRLTD